MGTRLTSRQVAIIDAFIACTEPSDANDREFLREALFSPDEYHNRLTALDLPVQEVLSSAYGFMQSECDNTSELAVFISEFSEDPGYQFSAGFILYYIAKDLSPINWHSSLNAELSLYLEDYGPNEDEEYSDRLDEIIKPLADESVASKIITKFFELVESGPRNTNGKSFCQALEENGLLPSK